jgi:hypothetical protein
LLLNSTLDIKDFFHQKLSSPKFRALPHYQRPNISSEIRSKLGVFKATNIDFTKPRARSQKITRKRLGKGVKSPKNSSFLQASFRGIKNKYDRKEIKKCLERMGSQGEKLRLIDKVMGYR